LLSALQVIFTWDPTKLQLNGYSTTGGPPLSISGFLSDAYGLNESNPPADGNGIFFALDSPGNPIGATQAGTLISTLMFTALAPTPLTPVSVLPSANAPGINPNTAAPYPLGFTQVFDGTVPNTDVTGTATGGIVTIVAVPAPSGAAAILLGALGASRRRRR
jgi:hypothetical protein